MKKLNKILLTLLLFFPFNSFSQSVDEIIDNYFENPNDFVPPVSKRLPDGSPIGSFSCDD